jgi:hypothetical protein
MSIPLIIFPLTLINITICITSYTMSIHFASFRFTYNFFHLKIYDLERGHS